MYTFFVCVIVCCLIGIVVSLFGYVDPGDLFVGLLTGFCVGLGIGLVALCVVSGIMYDAETTDDLVWQQEIVALKDNFTTKGSFFLGCGNIDDEQYYFYMSNDGKGMKAHKVEAEDCYINYSESNYRIEKYKVRFKDEWRNKWALPPDDYYYMIYVPEGSVTTKFSIDLE